MDKRRAIWIIAIFVFAKFGLHLYTNVFAGYGIFRDELYLYACALRPDIGYVDQPPLSAWILGLFTSVFGKSIFTIRTLAAAFGSLALIPVLLTVRLLGGQIKAIIIAGIAYVLSPIYLAYAGYYSMNSIDMLIWCCIIYLVVRLKIAKNPWIWVYLGCLMGLGLMNKIGMLWLGVGLFVWLLTSDGRAWLLTKWPYLAGLIALVIFSPYLLWNASHDWITLEFLSSAANKYHSMRISSFLAGQLLINNPFNIMVWVAGIFYFFTYDKHKRAFPLLILFSTILVILLVNVHSKSEYLSPIFFVLFICGALAIEKWSLNRRWIFYISLFIQLNGLVVVPLAIPILPVQSFIRYSKLLGITPQNAEGHDQDKLPQFYADMFGWENQAKSISQAYHQLPDVIQAKCALFGDNYGRSGAIDYFSDKYNLPAAIGRHNNYWVWGPGNYDGSYLLLLSNDIGNKSELFEDVTDLGMVTNEYAMPYENNLHIFLCKDLKIPVHDLWDNIKTIN